MDGGVVGVFSGEEPGTGGPWGEGWMGMWNGDGDGDGEGGEGGGRGIYWFCGGDGCGW